jgi:small subunit ribosomal protein S17
MKIFEGQVISTGMQKTVVVEVFRKTPHPLYKKLVKLSKKFKVDNTGFENVEVGSTVRIVETKPISKGKYFKIAGVVGEAKKVSPVLKTEKTEKVEAKAEVKPAKKAAKKTAKKENK